jgi:hypothetical protein
MGRRRKDNVTVGIDVAIAGSSEELVQTIAVVLEEFVNCPRHKWERAIDLGLEIEDWLAVTILELLIEDYGGGRSEALEKVSAKDLCAAVNARLIEASNRDKASEPLS